MTTLEKFVAEFTELLRVSQGQLDPIATAQGLLNEYQYGIIDGEFTIVIPESEVEVVED